MANNGKNRNKHAPNMKGQNPSASGEGGDKGSTRAKSNNPQDWKNEPGNQS